MKKKVLLLLAILSVHAALNACGPGGGCKKKNEGPPPVGAPAPVPPAVAPDGPPEQGLGGPQAPVPQDLPNNAGNGGAPGNPPPVGGTSPAPATPPSPSSPGSPAAPASPVASPGSGTAPSPSPPVSTAGPPATPENTQRWFGAANGGDVATLTAMLDSGWSANARDPAKRAALHYASNFGRAAALKLLLERRADVEARDATNLTPLMTAALKNDASAVRALLDAGAKVDARGFTGRDGAAESTALILAAEAGAVEVAELLIQRGADVNAVNNFNRTPLFWARKAGQQKMAELLLRSGAK